MNGAAVNPAEEELLRRAIELATTARKSGNPPFGSLLVGPLAVCAVLIFTIKRLSTSVSLMPSICFFANGRISGKRA